MDFNEFQENWHKAGEALNLRSDNGFNLNRKTSLDRLATRYRMFSLSALLAAGGLTLFFSLVMRHSGISLPLWLIISFEAYFLMASLMDYWLYQGVRSIDCSTMTVDMVLSKTMFYRKRHLQFTMLLVPIALANIILLGLCLHADTIILYGMIAGFLFGVTMGIRALMDFMKDYHKIME